MMAGERPWARAKARPDQDGAPVANPALAALLDHLAAELAQEYVRLMEDAGRDHRIQHAATTDKEG